jgi:multicomponent Na+:H+ antiporter subunit C
VIEALAVATLFGSGAYLLLRRDLIRDVVGMILVGNSVTLFLLASGLGRGRAPIHPLAGPASDPLVQAMALTAIVINFAISALLLSLVYAVYVAHGSLDQDDLLRAEHRDHAAQEEEAGR